MSPNINSKYTQVHTCIHNYELQSDMKSNTRGLAWDVIVVNIRTLNDLHVYNLSTIIFFHGHSMQDGSRLMGGGWLAAAQPVCYFLASDKAATSSAHPITVDIVVVIQTTQPHHKSPGCGSTKCTTTILLSSCRIAVVEIELQR